jgi:hypothetical protein
MADFILQKQKTPAVEYRTILHNKNFHIQNIRNCQKGGQRAAEAADGGTVCKDAVRQDGTVSDCRSYFVMRRGTGRNLQLCHMRPVRRTGRKNLFCLTGILFGMEE